MHNLQKPEVRFGDWIGEGWKMFSEQWQAWAVNVLIYFAIVGTPLIVAVIGFYAYMISTVTTASRSRNAPPDIGPEVIFGFYAIFFVLIVFAKVVGCFFTGGLHLSAIKQLQGGKVTVRDLFSGARYFFPVLGATLLIDVLTVVGSMLCVIPGFLVMGCLFFTMPLILHRRQGVIEAMQTSYELTKRNIWMFALFAFVAYLIVQAGSYACYVGILATYPLLFTITAVAYRDLFGVEGARYFRPSAPPPASYGQPYPQPYSGAYQPYPPVPYPPSAVNQPQTPPPVPQPVATDQLVPPKADNITAAATGLICSQCQTALPPNALFCSRCGTHTGQ